MHSAVVKRSVVIGGHKTSVSLEDLFWEGLREIAQARGITVSMLVNEIDDRRTAANLSSQLRLYVFSHFLAETRQHDSSDPESGKVRACA